MSLTDPSGLSLLVFCLVYAGMAVGRVPGLQVDRTGIAVIGAIVLVAGGAISGPQALESVDFPSLLVLAGLMVFSAQVGDAGLYDWCADRLARSPVSPGWLLGLVVAVGGILAALVTNDVVVFAMTPLLCSGLLRRGLDPRPYVLGLALAANAGSAATPIGNPQNILIAQAGALPFWDFVAACAPVAGLSLLVVWAGLWGIWRGRWELSLLAGQSQLQMQTQRDGPSTGPVSVQTGGVLKAVGGGVLLLVLLSTPMPQALAVVLVAGMLLVSRRFASRRTLLLVDWPLLVLFAALFIVTHAVGMTGVPGRLMADLAASGFDVSDPVVLATVALIGSNTIGNVPADMLILSLVPGRDPAFLHGLALLSTLAGNLLVTGSMANIIAVETAARHGVRIRFRDHARVGVPVTVVTMGLAVVWGLIRAAV